MFPRLFLKGILHEKTHHSSSQRAQYLMMEAVFSSFFENIVHELRSIKCLFLTTPVLSVGAPIPFKVGDRPPHTGRTALIVDGHPLIVGDHSPSFWADTPPHRRRPLPLLEGDHFSPRQDRTLFGLSRAGNQSWQNFPGKQ